MRDDAPDVFVGADLGTSGLKAVAISAAGEVLAQAGAGYLTSRPEPGASEQDPATWLTALRSTIGQLAQSVPAHRWRALALSGMIPTLVAVDHAGQPVGPAITWEDARAEPQAAALRHHVGAEALSRATGQWVDGRYLLPMLVRLAERDPGATARIARLAGAKDYLLWWLTGAWITDPSTATGYGCYGLLSGGWIPGVLDAASALLGHAVPVLPEIRDSGHVLTLSPERARALGLPARLPVVVGAADSVLAALGLGVREPGEVAYVAGTSTVILGVSDTLIPDPQHRYLVTPLAGADGWGLEMDLLATGSAIRWLSGLFGCTEPELVGLAASCDPGAAPCFLPYLAPGEQGALWDPLLTGTVTGLGLHHDRAHLARGLLNGITLESRRCLGLIADVTGRAGPVRVAGSSASAAVFRQDLADASHRTVVAGGSFTDQSALGAAILAARSLGVVIARPAPSGGPAGKPAPGAAPTGTFLPRPEQGHQWQGLATRHDELLAAIRLTRAAPAPAVAGRPAGSAPAARSH